MTTSYPIPLCIKENFEQSRIFYTPINKQVFLPDEETLSKIVQFIDQFNWSEVPPTAYLSKEQTHLAADIAYFGNSTFSFDVSTEFVAGGFSKLRRALLWKVQDKTHLYDVVQRVVNVEMIFRSEDDKKRAAIRASKIQEFTMADPYCFVRTHGIFFNEKRANIIQESYDFDFFSIRQNHFIIPGSNYILSMQERIQICLDIALELYTLHELENVHRDVKLENCLCKIEKDEKGNQTAIKVALTDFDCVGQVDHEEALRFIGGTVECWPPEVFVAKYMQQKQNPNHLKARDCWSFGILLCQMLEPWIDVPWGLGLRRGEIMFRIHNSVEKTGRIDDDDFRSIMTLFKQGASAEDSIEVDSIENLCLRLLSYNPEDRPTIRDVIDTLSQHLREDETEESEEE